MRGGCSSFKGIRRKMPYAPGAANPEGVATSGSVVDVHTARAGTLPDLAPDL